MVLRRSMEMYRWRISCSTSASVTNCCPAAVKRSSRTCDSVLCGCSAPTRYMGMLESTKIKIDSPAQFREASGRYQPQAGDQGSPQRVEWLPTWLRDLSPTGVRALREAFAGPTPQ